MGAKITIDSATLMNKGLEVIEAHHLFGLGYDRIEVVVHPQSMVHAMVRLDDGSLLAHLRAPRHAGAHRLRPAPPRARRRRARRWTWWAAASTSRRPTRPPSGACALAREAGRAGAPRPPC